MVEATMKSADALKRGDKALVRALAEPEKLFIKPFAAAMEALTKDVKHMSKIDDVVVRGFKRGN
jgi:hypothetical protein